MITWSHVFRLPAEMTPSHDAQIIGVLEDFQVGSVQREIPATVFYLQPQITQIMAVRIQAENMPATLNEIDRIWQEAGDPGPIRRQFFDQTIQTMYQNISRQAELLGIYASIAILIAILGLIGLAAFVAERRTREIGIRKVLGSSRIDIVRLMLWQFSRPVVISNLLAWPAAFLYLNYWLQGFESHMDMSLEIFVLASVFTILAAIATVFLHAIKVSTSNPVDALRME